MSDSLGKVVSIFIAVILMFLVPVKFYMERQENLNQTYLMTETVYLVDAIRNRGGISKEIYEEYLEKVSLLDGIYEIELKHVHFNYKSPEERKIIREDSYYTRQILEVLYRDGEYPMDLGDFFQVELYIYDHGIEVPMVYYGGSIRYEAD